MKLKTIASGSKGNCSLILCDETRFIIDMGISFLALKRSLEELNLSFPSFTGILITHNHSDHVKGLSALLKYTNLDVYIPEEMYDGLSDKVPKDRCHFITDTFTINDVSIELLHTSHDAPYSVGYIITHKNKSIAYITDTGYINRKILAKMLRKDAYLIESNHDEAMLMDGPYPRFLKERVISDHGHLSNRTTAKYLKDLVGDNTKYIILAHLSEKNNTEELALQALEEEHISKDITVLVAHQQEESPLIEV